MEGREGGRDGGKGGREGGREGREGGREGLGAEEGEVGCIALLLWVRGHELYCLVLFVCCAGTMSRLPESISQR